MNVFEPLCRLCVIEWLILLLLGRLLSMKFNGNNNDDDDDDDDYDDDHDDDDDVSYILRYVPFLLRAIV